MKAKPNCHNLLVHPQNDDKINSKIRSYAKNDQIKNQKSKSKLDLILRKNDQINNQNHCQNSSSSFYWFLSIPLSDPNHETWLVSFCLHIECPNNNFYQDQLKSLSKSPKIEAPLEPTNPLWYFGHSPPESIAPHLSTHFKHDQNKSDTLLLSLKCMSRWCCSGNWMRRFWLNSSLLQFA